MGCLIDFFSSAVSFTKEVTILQSKLGRSVRNTISGSTNSYSKKDLKYSNHQRPKQISTAKQMFSAAKSRMRWYEVRRGRFGYGGKRVDGVTRLGIGGMVGIGVNPPPRESNNTITLASVFTAPIFQYVWDHVGGNRCKQMFLVKQIYRIGYNSKSIKPAHTNIKFIKTLDQMTFLFLFKNSFWNQWFKTILSSDNFVVFNFCCVKILF